MKIFKTELNILITDFFKIKTRSERFILLIPPIILGFLSFFFIQFCSSKKCNDFNVSNFISDYLNAQINVMALFISFSLAYLTILVTSTSQSVEILKQKTSDIYKLNCKPVFLFQVVLVDLTYSIVIEIFLLIYSFIQKYLIIISSNMVSNIFLSIDILIISHIIIILLRNIKNIYLTFWKPDNNI